MSKLELWQQRLSDSNTAYSAEYQRMDEREMIYGGLHDLRPMVQGDLNHNGKLWKKTPHVRNIVFENIESQVSTAIPQPKVTAIRREDEKLAETIEHFLRNELDRLPFEVINDMAERTVPIQGGVAYLVEWDNTKTTHSTVGEVCVTLVHPKQFAPQPGVFNLADMDWFILKIPTTKAAIQRKYGISVEDESESEPDTRSVGGEDTADDTVTQYIGFEKGEDGINRFVWVNDIVLEDIDNYQARRQPVCGKCGHVRPLPGQVIGANVPDTLSVPTEYETLESDVAGQMIATQMADAMMATGANVAIMDIPMDTQPPKEKRYTGGPCPYCGADDWTDATNDYEEIIIPMRTRTGLEIPGATPALDDEGNPVMRPTSIPYYCPSEMPIVLQKSVSVFGQLLGNSDVDAIRDQQNTINRMESKIIDRLLKAGTRITLPSNASLRTDPDDSERWFIDNVQDKQLIDVYDFKGNLEYEMLYLANVYEESRQIIGITDSFQGRRDTTATSGKAKEFSAAQAAGRLESKRMMKHAAYAQLFEMIFKFWLAYSDEPRAVMYKDFRGDTVYEEFNRYDFLEQDEDGTYWWNDRFLFSCDTTAPLESNREAMWQETRMNLQTGAFGDPTQLDTLILFWQKMEDLHYPGAGQTRTYLEEKAQEQQMMMAQQSMAQQPSALPMPQADSGNMAILG